MARIAGIDLPREKRIEIALQYIFGVGPANAASVCSPTRGSIPTRASKT